MVTLEKIVTMRARTDASFQEAKAALEETKGDLEAAIALYLRRKGHRSDAAGAASEKYDAYDTPPHQDTHETNDDYEPFSAGPSTGQGEQWHTHGQAGSAHQGTSASSFAQGLISLLLMLFHKSCTTHFSVYKQGRRFFAIPLIAFAIVCLTAFWAIPIVLFIGLCAGFSYGLDHS